MKRYLLDPYKQLSGYSIMGAFMDQLIKYTTTRNEALVPANVKLVARTLREAGYKAWVVGGCVRDLLRGASHKISDWDLTTDAKPEEVMKLFPKVLPTGIQHGTVTVMLDGEGYEVTTLRGEGTYSDGRRPDEVFFVSTIEEDLARRDFTVNAMAMDPVSGEVSDPWGGREDLRAGVLRAVGDPMQRFSEDGLRVLRAARFCAVLGFALDVATEQAIAENLETFSKVARERVLAEWVKAIEKADRPSVAFNIMRSTGILGEVGGPLGTLSDEVFAKAMDRLDCAPRNFADAVAACLLEAGIPFSEADKWLRDMKASNIDRDHIRALVDGLSGAPTISEMLEWKPAELRRWVSKIPAKYRSAALAVYLLRPAGDPKQLEEVVWRLCELLESGAPLELKGLAVSGDELQEHLGLKPSRKLGEVLNGLLNIVLDDPGQNEKEILLSHARSML